MRGAISTMCCACVDTAKTLQGASQGPPCLMKMHFRSRPRLAPPCFRRACAVPSGGILRSSARSRRLRRRSSGKTARLRRMSPGWSCRNGKQGSRLPCSAATSTTASQRWRNITAPTAAACMRVTARLSGGITASSPWPTRTSSALRTSRAMRSNASWPSTTPWPFCRACRPTTACCMGTAARASRPRSKPCSMNSTRRDCA